MLLLAIVLLLALGLFIFILNLDIPGLWKFALVVVEMFIVGKFYQWRYKLPMEMGVFTLLRSKEGLHYIDELAKNKLVVFIADVGTVIAYGLTSLVITPRHVNTKVLLFGFITLAALLLFVGPTSFYVLITFLKQDVASASSQVQITLAQVLSLVLVLFSGLFGFILFSIVYYGFVVLSALADSILYGTTAINETPAGGQLLLPGINLPLIEGILALAIVLIVHEGAHAILARVGKIKLQSAGLVLFGIIPVGAFVEPDEDEFKLKNRIVKTRVLVAGTAFNFFASLILFALFLLFSTISIPELLFVRRTLALSFALNFIVGAINLLPVPLFDGFQIVDTNIKDKRIVNLLSYGALLFFLLNFLPNFF